MAKLKMDEIETFAELNVLLTSPILETLKNALQIPARMAEDIHDPIDFLDTVKKWDDYNPETFHDALKLMGRSDILTKAEKLEWLCRPSSKQTVRYKEPRSMKTLVRLLADDVTSTDWKIMTSQICTRKTGKIEPREMLKLCLDNNIITKDLTELSELMIKVKRNDIASRLTSYSATFLKTTEGEFRDMFTNEIECGESEGEEECRSRLREYLKVQHCKVSVTFESENTESMEHIYTPLTVVEEVPIVDAESEESSLTEMSSIRAMVTKLKRVKEVDFDKILAANTLESDPQLWLMIGSPGSGKTFLCKNIAFRFGISEVSNFQFVLFIPCRSEKWHQMEATRNDKGRSVTPQFVQEWLAISMSAFSKWSESLSKRLVETDGKSLLVIIDGMDEFTKSVPFQSTLLSLVLRRGLLSRASFLVTSRPGAWSQLSHQHGATFRVDSYFQVVGFSPGNRDLYFRKRIPNEQKLSAVRQLLLRHDEINQLSLVPVNASLFSSLFNQAASILSYTLTDLYSELVVYIIRRQLSRMGLTASIKNVSSLSDFHPGIQACIRSIGEEAYGGVFDRHLTSSNAIPLCLDGGDVESERLGLMESCVKEVKVGEKEKVWTFTHLTIQEFMSALFFRANSWSDQCAMVRFLVSSSANFSMFKMVIRFSCGILKENTGAIIPILCHKLTPTPIPMHDMPMLYQLYYNPTLVGVSDWYKFTSTFLTLATIICETNPETISKQFCHYYAKYLPDPLYFYFRSVLSPNEWHCFVQSLRYVKIIQLIHINTQLISPEQFSEFLHQLSSCSLCYLSLFFAFMTSSSLARYTRLLTTATLPPSTKVSIYLYECDLTENVQLFRTNPFVGSLGFRDSNYSFETLHRLTNQFSSIENVYYRRTSANSDWSILQQSIRYHQVTGLFIHDPNAYLITPDFLSGLSSLQELHCSTKLDSFTLLPFLQSLSRVTYLFLLSTHFPPSNESHRDRIMQLINRNSNSLRHLSLPNLHLAGFHDWSSFLPTLHSCSNLVLLQLSNTKFPLHGIRCWYEAVSALSSLVYFELTAVPLQDEGLWVVCHSLTHHPAIRRLWITECGLTPESCRTLSCLIQTLPRIRKLTISKAELFRPDFQLQSLLLAAVECSVEIELY